MNAQRIRYLGVCGPSEKKECMCGEKLFFREIRYFIQADGGGAIQAGIAWLAPSKHKCVKPEFLERVP